MSTNSLFITAGVSTTQVGPGRKRIGQFFPDIFTKEAIKFSNTITDEPIESGEVVQDHIFHNPITIELAGLQSETALNVVSQNGTVKAEQGRALKAYDALKVLYDTKTPFEIVIGLGVFSNMLVESLNIDQTNNTGDALPFDVSLKQITVVDSKVTESNRRVVDARKVSAKIAPKQASGSTPRPGERVAPKLNQGTSAANKVPRPKVVGRLPAVPTTPAQTAKVSPALERVRAVRKRLEARK